MKASQLIKQIEAKIKSHGDLEVGIWEYQEWVACEILSSEDFYDDGTFFGSGEGFKGKFIFGVIE